VAIVVSLAIYPFTFLHLAKINLVTGSFLACLVLLGIPLLAMSAMNPLLVALKGAVARPETGDAGSGWVFFVSTMGSVAGVLFATFIAIPYLTNFRSFALLGAAVGVAALASALAGRSLSPTARVHTSAMALVGTLAGLALGIWADDYLGWKKTLVSFGLRWTMVEHYPTPFGSLKVIDVASGQTSPQRFLLNDGILQNINDAEEPSRSLAVFTHALEALAIASVSSPRRALVLGLGTGAVPMGLAARGIDVDVVDINPALDGLIRRHFAFKDQRVTLHWGDARTFANACTTPYDIVIMDLFNSDGMPEHLLTEEVFHHLGRCVTAKGSLIVNAFYSNAGTEGYRMIFAAINKTFPSVRVFGDLSAATSNIFVLAQHLARPLDEIDISPIPQRVSYDVRSILATVRTVGVDLPLKDDAASDEHNRFAVNIAPALVALRRHLVSIIPSQYLIN
ncbi:MAG: fused MFS/spermidine synthase, partial [Alphaproteobacteria bacterium]